MLPGAAHRARLSVHQPSGELGGHPVDPSLLGREEALPGVLLGLPHRQGALPQRRAPGLRRGEVGGEAVHLGPRLGVSRRDRASSGRRLSGTDVGLGLLDRRGGAGQRLALLTEGGASGRRRPTELAQPDPVGHQPSLDRRRLLEGDAVLAEGRQPAGRRRRGPARRPEPSERLLSRDDPRRRRVHPGAGTSQRPQVP